MRKIVGLALVLVLFAEAEGSSGITYHGRLLDPTGNPVLGAVQFRLEIRTPAPENCLLYAETQSTNLTATKGVFSLQINSSSSTRQDSNPWTLNKAFSNKERFEFAPSDCSSNDEWLPGPTDGRNLRVSFNAGSGWEELPLQSINFVPMAIEAYTVGGHRPSHFLRVEDGAGTPQSLTAWSPTDYSRLVGIVAGTQGIGGSAAGFTGSLSGDVTGGQGATSVVALRGQALSSVAPANGQVLMWNSVSGEWTPTNPPAGGGSSAWADITGKPTTLAGYGITDAGSVSSVGVSVPGYMTSTGGPVTTSGTIALGFSSQAESAVFAGPTSGSGTPGFRNLRISDVKANSAGNPSFWNILGGCPVGEMPTHSSVTDRVSCAPFGLTTSQVTAALGYTPANPANVAMLGGNSVASTMSIGTNSNHDFALETNGVSRLTATTQGRIGVGTPTPEGMLHILGNAPVYMDRVGSSFGVHLLLRSAGGTVGSETAVTNGQTLGRISFQGHNGTNFTVGSDTGIASFATENWTTTANGSSLNFYTVQNGMATRSERIRITHDGNVGVGTVSPVNTLHVNGTVRWRGHSVIERPPTSTGQSVNKYHYFDTFSSLSGNTTYALIARFRDGTSWATGSTLNIRVRQIRYDTSAGWTEYTLRRGGNLSLNSSVNGLYDYIRVSPVQSFGGKTDVYEIWAVIPGHRHIAVELEHFGSTNNIAAAAASAAVLEPNFTDVRTETDPGYLVGPVSTYFVQASSGNVGIGTMTPSQKLDVTGNIRATQLCIGADCRGAWPAAAGGTVTSVGSGTGLTGGPITGAGTLSVDVGTTANKILQLDGSAQIPAVSGALLTNLNAAQLTSGSIPAGRMPALAENHLWVGNSSNQIAARYFGVGDLRTTAGNPQFPSSCTTSQTLTWSAVTDVFSCSNISITTAQISNLSTSLNNHVLKSGDTMTGALSLPANGLAVGTNQLVVSGANVGIGTAAPTSELHIATTRTTGLAPALLIQAGKNSGQAATVAYQRANSSQQALFSFETGASSTPDGYFGTLGGKTGAIYMLSGNGATTRPAVGVDTNNGLVVGTSGSITSSFNAQIKADGSAYFAGDVGIGTTNPTASLHNSGPNAYYRQDTGSDAATITRFSANSTGPFFWLGKSRNGTIGAHTIVQNGDSLGGFIFQGSDGAVLRQAASIGVNIDGSTVDSTSMPGRISFSTTPSGSISAVERVRISSDGNVGVGTSSPTVNLDVVGHIRAQSNSTAYLSIRGDYANTQPDAGEVTGVLVFGSDGVAGATIPANGITLEHENHLGAHALSFKTHNNSVATERMRIHQDGNIGIGTSTPVAKLDVAGEVKFGNTSSACNATNEGQQRYNSSTKIMEFCNGTAWTAFGAGTASGRTSCPTGFSLVGTSGSPEAYCISSNEEASANWLTAVTNCSNKVPAARLCTTSEWAHACVKAATYGITGITGNWEWTAELSFDGGSFYSGLSVGASGCNSGTYSYVHQSNPSRCCFR